MGEHADDLIEREIREHGQRLAREAMREALPDPAEVRRQLPADMTLTTSGPHGGHWHWQGHPDVVAWAREPLEAHGEALACAASAC